MKLEQHEKKVWKAYQKHIGKDWATKGGFREAFEGEWDTEEKYAIHIFDECYATAIPENLRGYIDYEAFARDLFINDFYSIECPNGGVWVFRNT